VEILLSARHGTILAMPSQGHHTNQDSGRREDDVMLSDSVGILLSMLKHMRSKISLLKMSGNRGG
jgi:hypothetical protein